MAPYNSYNDESIFNMALAYLSRIDKLLNLCAMHSIQGNLEGWSKTITSLYREVSIKLSDKEKLELNGDKVTLKTINLHNLEEGDCTFKNMNALCNNIVYLETFRKQILFMLHHLEMKLRKYMQVKGMLLPSKDDPARAITKF